MSLSEFRIVLSAAHLEDETCGNLFMALANRCSALEAQWLALLDDPEVVTAESEMAKPDANAQCADAEAEAKPKKATTKKKKEAPRVVTYPDMLKALQDFRADYGDTASAAAVHKYAGRFVDLKPEDYPALMADLEEYRAKHAAKGSE